MLTLKQLFGVIISTVSLFATFFSVCKLILFLSVPKDITQTKDGRLEDLIENRGSLKTICRDLCWNTIWIILFILQHSFTKAQVVRKFWNKVNLGTLDRAIYNLVSSYTLVLLLQNWKTTNSTSFWKIEATPYSLIWYVFIGAHVLAWNTICFGSLLMDLPEILGIKQVYYEIKGLGEPSLYKARELNRLLDHVRHPSFTGFFVILWCTNLMSLDRLILAVFFTLYMYFAWNPDRKDVSYQKQQLERKKLELKYDLKKI